MEPKKVWSVIIIVLGVSIVIGGFQGLYFAYFCEREIASYDNQAEYFDKTFHRNYGESSSTYLNLYKILTSDMDRSFSTEKIICFFSMLIGAVCSIVGTLLLKKKVKPNNPDHNDKQFNFNIAEVKQDNSKKDKIKDDDTRWMPPEMRKRL